MIALSAQRTFDSKFPLTFYNSTSRPATEMDIKRATIKKLTSTPAQASKRDVEEESAISEGTTTRLQRLTLVFSE
eukprot:31452-Amphidinium_carterae.1